ncbi:MAG: hypothetical protein LCH32_11575 [Bacteroidetes bacterium]|nr:hypothetical protein [Bacteroidota bacterium]
MKKVAIICITDYTREPRVLRTIEALKNHYSISVYSTNTKIEGVENTIDVINLNKDFYFQPTGNVIIRKIKSAFSKFILGYKFGTEKYFNRQYWSIERYKILNLLQKENADVYIGHGIYTLPLLAKLSNQAKVVFNAHEYYPLEFEENKNWITYTKPYYNWILNNYFNKINLTFSVTASIGKMYEKEFKINWIEVTNATKYYELKPVFNSRKIKLLHHGAALEGRRIEEMCELMELLPDNYELNLMLVKTNNEYYNKLFSKYISYNNINFIEPVEFSKIPEAINKFDIGLYILKPNNFNEEHCLPNKFFEFIQARLCIAVTPNTDMKYYVQNYNLGVVSKGFTAKAMSEEILKLSHNDIDNYKKNVDSVAKELSNIKNNNVILNSINKLCAA